MLHPTRLLDRPASRSDRRRRVTTVLAAAVLTGVAATSATSLASSLRSADAAPHVSADSYVTTVTTTGAAQPRDAVRAGAEPVHRALPATRSAPATTAPHIATAPRHRVQRLDYGCASALSYLHRHAAPGFRFACPGNANGHQAMTCVYDTSCPGEKLIAIADPCPAAYRNEASNSWVLTGRSDAPIDPFGYCH